MKEERCDRASAKLAQGINVRRWAQPSLWYDARPIASVEHADMLGRVLETPFTGVISYPQNIDSYCTPRFRRLDRIFCVDDDGVWAAFCGARCRNASAENDGPHVIASASETILGSAAELGYETCLRVTVASSEDLAQALARAAHKNYLSLCFNDPTNIPLELAIAHLQSSRTAIFKEIDVSEACDDVIASIGTMEFGVDGIVTAPQTLVQLERVAQVVRRSRTTALHLETATVVTSRAVGMGHRACLDLVDLLSPNEGLIVGSTSQGGILCCAEVFPMPYMEKRPFRINAGGVHSYLFGPDNRTSYLTETRSGQECLVVNTSGETRTSPLGRTKVEVRPLRLLTCRFTSGASVSIIMQDDWHVRVFGGDGSARNLTELRPGDEVLAYQARPGRHVGIQVSEFIEEW